MKTCTTYVNCFSSLIICIRSDVPACPFASCPFTVGFDISCGQCAILYYSGVCRVENMCCPEFKRFVEGRIKEPRNWRNTSEMVVVSDLGVTSMEPRRQPQQATTCTRARDAALEFRNWPRLQPTASWPLHYTLPFFLVIRSRIVLC